MKKIWFTAIILCIGISLSACGGQDKEDAQDDDQIKMLKVDFQLPDSAKVKEDVALKAVVTYGDEPVEDADEVTFEYWKKNDKEHSTKVKSKNNKDGTYTTNIAFDEAETYEVYAHTTAKDLHTMPKKSIEIKN